MARERLVKSVSTTSDSQGRATFTLGPAEQGFVWEGSVQIPNCPAGTLFAATVLGANWGQWAGPTNFGPIQMYGGESLTVTATGLNPSTAYVLTIFGVWMPEYEAEPIPPAAPMSVVSVETATLLVNNASPSGSPNKITGIRPPSLTRRLTLIPTSGGASGEIYQLIGNQSGAVYGLFFPGNHNPQYMAIEPTIDQTYTLQYFSGTSANFTVSILASFSNPLVTGSPLEPVPTIFPFGMFNGFFGPVSLAYLTSNQVAAVSPGTGLSYFIQTLTISSISSNGPVRAVVHASNGVGIWDVIVPSTGSESIEFPGGYELPSNTGIQVDTFLASAATSTHPGTGGTLNISGTLVSFPTI